MTKYNLLIFLSKDLESDAAKQFLNAAIEVDDFRFGITSDADVLKEYEVSADAVVLLKKFDGGKVAMEGDIVSEAIVRFVKTESLPLVIEFNHESAQKIFGGDIKNHLLIFFGKSHAEAEKITENARQIAKDFKGKVSFIWMNKKYVYNSKFCLSKKLRCSIVLAAI